MFIVACVKGLERHLVRAQGGAGDPQLTLTVPDGYEVHPERMNVQEHGNGYVVEFFKDAQTQKCATSWLMVPGANLWNQDLAAALYFFGMVFVFMGVSIIADIFMAAVEVITAKEKTAHLEDGTEVSVKYWNPTVANLTLMALGSSSPEILLAVIETGLTLNSKPGELGPSTIVGSAAFNLLIISAICVVSIPKTEVKRIADLGVFLVTAVWSVGVYIWMLIALTVWTPGVISPAEAWITFLAMFLFVGLAYAQDQNWWREEKPEDGRLHRSNTISGAAAEDLEDVKVVAVRHRQSKSVDAPTQATEEDDANLKSVMNVMKHGDLHSHQDRKASLQVLTSPEALQKTKSISGRTIDDVKKDPLFWKINARKQLTGQKHYTGKAENRVNFGLEVPESPLLPSSPSQKGHPLHTKTPRANEDAKIFFSSSEYCVLESAGSVEVSVKRKGLESLSLRAHVKSFEGTAKEGDDFDPVDQIVTFGPGEKVKNISIPIHDDDIPEPDLTFHVELFDPEVFDPEEEVVAAEDVKIDVGEPGSPGEGGFGPRVGLGAISVSQIVIIDDDDPGLMGFQNPLVEVSDSAESVSVKVVRSAGAKGTISCKYHTRGGSAVAGEDFGDSRGELIFLPGVVEQTIEIRVFQNGEDAAAERVFHVFLTDPTGSTFTRQTVCLVKIKEDTELAAMEEEVKTLLSNRMRVLLHGTNSWWEQSVEALSPGGGVDDDGNELELTNLDYILHFLTIFWKVFFSLVPPTDYWGGWATFFVSLLMIGLTTAIVGELASLFGCAIGLKDPVTAIIFVALGTSLPDTFASRIAALEAEDADAAIGNITGSNTVNVLLGLGLPWVMGTIYYQVNDDKTGGKYCVPSSGLGYSVMIFSLCAVVCIATLLLRRFKLGGELGGKGNGVTAVVFVSLWVFYILMSSLQMYGHIKFGEEKVYDKYGCDCSAPHSSGIGC